MNSSISPSREDSIERVLPLRLLTPPIWAKRALEDPIALLVDHALLEKKASLNALKLLHQWPEGFAQSFTGGP